MAERLSKNKRKQLKAVYQVHICVNTLNEQGAYDIRRGSKRAESWRYYKHLEEVQQDNG